MKFTVEVTLAKGEGSKQDPDAVREALDDAISDLGSIYAQDSDHDEETEYEITNVIVLST